MPTVTSRDGTSIAYDQAGAGPALILVDGALCFRAFGPMGALAALLAPHCTVSPMTAGAVGRAGTRRPTPWSVRSRTSPHSSTRRGERLG